MPEDETVFWNAMMSQVRARHPRFVAAVVADAREAATTRGERSTFRGRGDALVQVLRLAWQSDGFIGLCFYRAQARFDTMGMPILAQLAHHLAAMTSNIVIGETVVVEPGIFIGHGSVVVDGLVEIQRGTALMPNVTIGLPRDPRLNMRGPTIGKNVRIGTGARVLGPINVGDGALVGANAVVLQDVPPNATAVGVPARVIPARK
jgi:serine O-acetyltransferase